MKTKTAPKRHQAERCEAQPQPPLAEAPSEEISEARLNQLAKDYGPSIKRAITAFNREIEHYLFGDDATEPARAQPGVLTLPPSTPAPGTPPLSCLNAQEGTSQDVYESLRDHQPTRHEKLLLARTHLPLIIERFYGGNLPLPVLSWYRAHWRNFCSWHVQLDDLGLSHWININLLHLGRPLAEILLGLTHELGHEHEFPYGKPAKRPYHSKAFQNRMREIGIPCSTAVFIRVERLSQAFARICLAIHLFIRTQNAVSGEPHWGRKDPSLGS